MTQNFDDWINNKSQKACDNITKNSSGFFENYVIVKVLQSTNSTLLVIFFYALPFLPGELQYSPAVLQQRMAAELQYLESIEESVRQLDNMEKLMGVSMAQQESVSLAQMLKVLEDLVWDSNNTDVEL